MKRRTFIQLGAVTAALAALPHQVAQAVETAKRGATKWLYPVDEAAFFLVALSTEVDHTGKPLEYRAFPRTAKSDLIDILDQHSVVDEVRGLRWFKVPALRSIPLFEGEGAVMSGGRAIQYMAHNILRFERGSWREDRKVRDPNGYFIPKEILTTKYKHIHHFPSKGDIFAA